MYHESSNAKSTLILTDLQRAQLLPSTQTVC